MKKRIRIAGSILILSLLLPRQVFATSIDEIKNESKKTQQGLEQTEDKINDITSQKSEVNSEITVLDAELVDILTSISICEDEISQNKIKIDVAKEELEKAQAKEQSQYENMKKRIQFMYEKGDGAYLQVFLEASSLPEMLNKASYIEKLYDYDRKLLIEYGETKKQVEALKEELEYEQANLITSQNELQEQQSYLETMLAEKRATVANFDSQLASAKKEADAYKKQLKEQNDAIKKIEEEEAKKAEEEAKRAEEAKKEDSSSNESNTKPETSTDNSTNSGLGSKIANFACGFIGNPYVFGGTSLTNGTDCSGFTQSVYAHFGIRIPRDSTSQRSAGVGVDYANARPGDLVCYAGHVGLYIGNGQIVHASSEKTGIKISNATYRTILAVRRIVN